MQRTEVVEVLGAAALVCAALASMWCALDNSANHSLLSDQLVAENVL